MDSLAIKIGAGLIFAVLCIVIALIHRKRIAKFDGFVAFSMCVFFVGGVEIIYVAFTGDLNRLPTGWRAYFGLGGFLCANYALQKMADVLLKAFSKKPKSRKEIVDENNTKD